MFFSVFQKPSFLPGLPGNLKTNKNLKKKQAG